MALAPMHLHEPAGLQLPEHACQERTERHQRGIRTKMACKACILVMNQSMTGLFRTDFEHILPMVLILTVPR